MNKKSKVKQAAVMWIRDGVLINRMPINAVAFAYAYFLSASDAEQESLSVTSLVNFAFAKSGISCLEKITLRRSSLGATLHSIDEPVAPDFDLDAAVKLYNALATEAACSASYFDGAIETLAWLKTCGASNFITSAVEQEVLDAWAYSPQGRLICSRSGPITEILGRRPNFCKGRDHFRYVSDWLSGTVSHPQPDLVKTIYYVADAVSEIKQGREFSAEFSIVPIGFAHHIDSAQVLAAASLVKASLEKLVASGAIAVNLSSSSSSSSSSSGRLALDESQLELPSAAALEASLRQAGAAHVVRNFDELRRALDPQSAYRAFHVAKVKSRPMKPITMVVLALALVTGLLAMRVVGWIVLGIDRGTPQLIEYATDVVDSDRLRLLDKDGRWLSSKDDPYAFYNARKIFFDNELLQSPPAPIPDEPYMQISRPFYNRRFFDGSQIGIDWYAITKLKDGRLFISGGKPREGSIWRVPGDTVETFRSNRTFFYDPVTADYSKGPNLLQPRACHTATLLEDGRVLITGGGWPLRAPNIREVEIFDPKKNTVSLVGVMNKPRENHGAASLRNGKILLVGGRTAADFSDADENLTSTVELLDLNTSTCTVVGQLHQAREFPEVFPVGASGAIVLSGSTDAFRDDPKDSHILTAELYAGTKTSKAKSVVHTPSLDELFHQLCRARFSP